MHAVITDIIIVLDDQVPFQNLLLARVISEADEDDA